MTESPGSVVTLLCSGIRLYNAERRIADCILADVKRASTATSAELARESHASEATVTRLCHKLGFESYRKFQLALARDVLEQQQQTAELTVPHTAPDPLRKSLEQILANRQEELRATYHALELSQLRETLTAIRKSGDFTVPCYGVLTDYTCIPFLAETDLDGYFIAHEDLRAELVEKGIPSDRIIVTGIPVDEKFAHHMEKAAARNYLAIPQNQDVFLIMSGGIGVGNAGAICDEILRRHSGAFTVYILVGRNSDLKQTLEEKYAGNEHVRIVTFTKKVNVYMNAADVMISKPGGLTSTEAAVAQVPLVQLLVYTACEAPNIAFFSSHGLSERAENAADAAEKAVALVRDKARAEAMREAQRNTIAPDAADKIAERIVLS